jgi:hypothetical protein
LRRIRLTTLLLLMLVLGVPRVVGAQPLTPAGEVVDWRELETEHFIIVYAEHVSLNDAEIPCACGIAEAQRYADFADQIYMDLVSVFGATLDTPINLQLFPTETSYYTVNPLAQRLTGVIAHALNDRQEIAIAVPRTAGLTEEELVNNVRHELTHLFAGQLSDGKLSAGFQEGVAQYLEKPTARADYDPAVLRLAMEEGRLLTWAELDEAQQVYGDPQVAYPQSLSVVSFLVDRYGFPRLIEFLQTTASEPGFRSALAQTYARSADELETEWLGYLPEYFSGRWQINAIYAYDLTRVNTLVEQAAYSSAQAELEEIIALLETTDQEETLSRATALMARAHQGLAAGSLADEARGALQAHDYDRAISKSQAAMAAYERVGYRARLPELQALVQQGERGLDAIQRLEQGERLLGSLRFGDAEREIAAGTAALQSLGDTPAAKRGVDLLNASAARQRGLAYGMLAIGLVTLFFNGLRRLLNRLRPDPLEVDWI